MHRWLGAMAILGMTIAANMIAGAPPAEARVFVGVGVGVPLYAPPPPVYYYPPPPPVYYAPPVVYAPSPPPPPIYAPPPQQPSITPAPPQTGNCRQYRGDAKVDGRSQPFYGTACLQPDGKWHVVN
jgi:hypothetical protein